jgi:hypothetical protein
MLRAQIRECLDCGSLQQLLDDLNCTLSHLGRNHWLNTSFDACNFYSRNHVSTLIHYKRILTKKMFNPDYGCNADLASIISRVKTLLIVKDCRSFNDCCEFPTADTFEEVSTPD